MTAPPRIPAALCGLYPGAPTHVARSRGETYGRTSSVYVSPTGDSRAVVEFTGETMDTCLAGVSLLLDSPLALCHAARWLATRMGMDPGATAPWWRREHVGDRKQWVLRVLDETWCFDRGDILDPSEAIAAACVALGDAR